MEIEIKETLNGKIRLIMKRDLDDIVKEITCEKAETLAAQLKELANTIKRKSFYGSL